jgi:hypothetical protein
MRPFDTHGDLKNDLLDYLELQRHPPQRPRSSLVRPDPENRPMP